MTLESYWLENCLYYDSRVVIYEHKLFIRLTTVPNSPARNVSVQNLKFLQMDLSLSFSLSLNIDLEKVENIWAHERCYFKCSN